MASAFNVAVCSLFAVALYSLFGFALAARLGPRFLALALAPGLGWAVHTAAALPLFFLFGMSRTSVALAFAVPLACALLAIWRGWAEPRGEGHYKDGMTRSALLAVVCAAALSAAVVAGVLPKVSSEGVALAAPIFDHSKIAIINEIMRLGVPSTNPFFGMAGQPVRLSYYYLWHFGAAELALLCKVSAWEADAVLTWFTAFASLAMMMGLATWLGGRASSAVWVVVLAATGSIRPILYGLFGIDQAEEFVGNRSGFGGWLFQTSWAPQHVASATCAVLAIFLLVHLFRRQSVPALVMFALTMAAAFETSTWVGGVAFPLAAAPVALFMLMRTEPERRLRAAIYVAAAVVLAMLLISPFLLDQLKTAALRGGGIPVEITPYDVFGEEITDRLGELSNLPAYWLVLLPVEFPAFYLAGIVSFVFLLRRWTLTAEQRIVAVVLGITIAVSLGIAWLMVSTLGDNNDLGWRAVLPAVMLLIVFAAIGMPRIFTKRVSWIAVACAALLAAGVPDGADLIYGNAVAAPNASSRAFAQTPELWQAVRRHASPVERVANNPHFMDGMTPWGANISWALFSNRRSCYAGDAYLGPFTTLSQAEGLRVETMFKRVFAGNADPDGVGELATRYNCSVAVVTPQDGAWTNDPFAASSYYRLAESGAAWRIYTLVKTALR